MSALRSQHHRENSRRSRLRSQFGDGCLNYFNHPPDIAGTMAISAPSVTGVARFSRNRTSSPSRYILMNRRRDPDSSHTLARKPGYLESRLSSTSLTVAASTSTVSAPDVNFLSGVGITTLSDMACTPKYFFEVCELRLDHLRRRQIQRVKCF